MSAVTITFQVNLNTLQQNTALQPYTGFNTTATNYYASTRSTWFPDNLIDNHQLKNGAQFTVTDAEAMYLYNNYTTGPYAFLTVVNICGIPTTRVNSLNQVVATGGTLLPGSGTC